MKIVTNTVNPYVVAPIIIISTLVVRKKLKMMNFLFYLSIGVTILSWFKSLYHLPRPFMEETKIHPLENYTEYGSPSGHASLGYLVWAWILE